MATTSRDPHDQLPELRGARQHVHTVGHRPPRHDSTRRASQYHETARLVGRDVKNVHLELSELAQLHVIYFEEDGQAKRPVVWFDELCFEIDMPAPTTDEAESPPA